MSRIVATVALHQYGCEIISDPGVIPVKFRAPGGAVAELVPVAATSRRRGRRVNASGI